MASRQIRRNLGTAAAALGLTLCLTGCGYPNRGSRLDRMGAAMGLAPDTAAFDPPKLRLGVMPFDAWYSPWEAIDADALGQHRHEGEGLLGTPLGSPRGAEVSRGVMYTRSGGFLDIAHLRNAVDLTLFVHREVAPWLREDDPVVLQLLAAEPDLYRLTLTPPPEATAAERDEAAVEIAGRVAYLMTTWHEVLTWFGYRGLGVITERPSAFSYDDAPSHRVGVELAMAVLRELAPDPTRAVKPGRLEVDDALFDAAVTAALPVRLRSLGVVPPAEATRRMQALEGLWWADGRPILRVVDLGLDGSPLRALVAPRPRSWTALACCSLTPARSPPASSGTSTRTSPSPASRSSSGSPSPSSRAPSRPAPSAAPPASGPTRSSTPAPTSPGWSNRSSRCRFHDLRMKPPGTPDPCRESQVASGRTMTREAGQPAPGFSCPRLSTITDHDNAGSRRKRSHRICSGSASQG